MRPIASFSALLLMAIAGGCHKQVAEAPQPAPTADASAAKPDPVAVVATNVGKPAPAAPFDDLAGGTPTTLAAFKGKPVLLNLWATWCAPCVRELPTLDRLAQTRAGKLAVVTVSEDLEGAKVVVPYLQKHGLKALHPYHDRNNALMLQLKEASLPVSILYGGDGREIWRVPGDLDWSGAKARELLAQAGT